MENKLEKLVPVEHDGQRVITTELLAEVYETEAKNIQMNFANQKKNFREGIHYFVLRGEALKAFKDCPNNIGLVGKNAPTLYLWTERGANRHCKILDTPKAWEQFDNLEETYFAVKEHRESVGAPKSAMEMLRVMSQATIELDDRVTGLEVKVERQMTIDHGQQRQLQRVIGERAYERAAEIYPTNEVKASVGPFFKAIYKDLKNRFGVGSYRDIRPTDYAAAVAYVEHWIEPADVRNRTH